ncbi:helix-turn-helix domain-containing protein [Streptomyces sp. NPDC012510]|uniref:helix-turn-helix domain-containing protein n=1 Tax=Streptomyces sp. NPDC012510 TaxID=3364838 RepID=UPI0036ED57B5
MFYSALGCGGEPGLFRECPIDGTDIDHGLDQRVPVPTDPMPDWVLQRRRAIGDNIRAERTRQKLTQERLAELTDLDRKTVNRIEQGATATLIDHLLLIADVLEVPLSDLVR